MVTALDQSEHLPAGQLAERAWLGQELIISPGLDDPAVLEHVDAIGLDDRVEPVGDHDPGDAPELVGQAVADDA